MGHYVRDGLISIVVVLLSLAAVEAGGRIIGIADDPTSRGSGLKSIIEFDGVMETRYRPGAQARVISPFKEYDVDYTINELGLRDDPVPEGKPPGEFRILAVGNSFVEGWGVARNASFISIAGDLAGNQLGRPVRVVNAGISGYGAAQSLLQAKVLSLKLNVDAIVLVLVGTMLSADHNFLSRAALDSGGIAQGIDPVALFDAPKTKNGGGGPASGIPRWLSFLAEYSELARFAAQRLANLHAMDRVVAGDPSTDMLAAYRVGEDRLPELFEPTLRHVRALHALARERGLKFALVHLPMPFLLSTVEWGKGREAFRLSESKVSSAEATLIEKACHDAGMICYFADSVLTGAVAKSLGETRAYFDYDFHLNERGNEVVGTWLAGKLSALANP